MFTSATIFKMLNIKLMATHLAARVLVLTGDSYIEVVGFGTKPTAPTRRVPLGTKSLKFVTRVFIATRRVAFILICNGSNSLSYCLSVITFEKIHVFFNLLGYLPVCYHV